MKDRLHSKCPNGQQIDFSENGLKGGDSTGCEPETSENKKKIEIHSVVVPSIDLSFEVKQSNIRCLLPESRESRMENEIRHL